MELNKNVTATQGNQRHYFEFQNKTSKFVLPVRFRKMLVSNLGRGNGYPRSLVISLSSFKNAGIGLQIKLRTPPPPNQIRCVTDSIVK